MSPASTAMLTFTALTSGTAAASGAATSNPIQGAAFWRWPYGNSPHVIAANPRDGLPDFDYFDAENSSLTSNDIECPSELTLPCTSDTHKHDEGCGSDKRKACYGGVYCEISHKEMQSNNLTDVYFPNFVAAATEATPVNRTRRNILQRAVGWLAVHAPYMGCTIPKSTHDGVEMCGDDDGAKCPQYTYTLTCEGLISMAWGSPGYGGNKPHAESLAPIDLQPGDAIPVRKYSGKKLKGISHFLMFREWVEGKKGEQARVYQMGGAHGTTNMDILGAKHGKITWCPEDAVEDVEDGEEPESLEQLGGLESTGSCHGALRYGSLVEE